jgi:D-sedoheptulose 7-phosphate isomerase
MGTTAQPFVRAEIERSLATLTALLADEALLADIARGAELCTEALRRDNKLMFAGNGGSAADAQHLAAELVGRLNVERAGLPALALTTDSSVLTALGNDYGFADVFRRQVEALGRRGDVLIAISTSGRSKNIVAAVAAARTKGITTIGLTGAAGGDLAAACDICLRVPSGETQKIHEAHMVIGHIICGLVERAMFPAAP